MKVPILLMAYRLDIAGTVGCFHSGTRGDELKQADIPEVHFPVTSYHSPNAITQANSLARSIHRHRVRIVHTWD